MSSVILAPHPDDEVIGCFQQLEKKMIDYVIFFEWDNIRKVEAEKCAEYFGFKALFGENKIKKIKVIRKLFIPSSSDYHPLHKYANGISYKIRAQEKIYYTVDKNIFFSVLSQDFQVKKCGILNNIYSSQKNLWQNDAKYVLFEGYRDKDYTTWAKVIFQFTNIHVWKTIPDNHSEQYLKYDHRHVFHCAVWVEQFHDDRDIEYMELQSKLKKEFYDWNKEYFGLSCEMLADHIYNWVKNIYLHRQVHVQVTEDGENGAFIE